MLSGGVHCCILQHFEAGIVLQIPTKHVTAVMQDPVQSQTTIKKRCAKNFSNTQVPGFSAQLPTATALPPWLFSTYSQISAYNACLHLPLLISNCESAFRCSLFCETLFKAISRKRPIHRLASRCSTSTCSSLHGCRC